MRALQSVDDNVEAIVQKLQDLGLLDNTCIQKINDLIMEGIQFDK
jgi:arylsulfatase A-like enzyme